MPNAPDTTSIEHRALTPTVRTPQCGHTVWVLGNHPQIRALVFLTSGETETASCQSPCVALAAAGAVWYQVAV